MDLDNTTIETLHHARRSSMIARLHRNHPDLDTADLVDEAFAHAVENPGRYRSDTASPEAWINGIADNLARNQRRRNQAAANYHAAQPAPEDLLDTGFEDLVTNAAVASTILTTLATILTDLDAGDAALINGAILTTLGGYATTPLTSAARVQLHRIRTRLSATLARIHPNDE